MNPARVFLYRSSADTRSVLYVGADQGATWEGEVYYLNNGNAAGYAATLSLDGEEMLTEVSCKFRPTGVDAELEAAGLRRTHWWTDEAGDFGLSLSVK